jgi:hypothetical protein
MVRGEGIAMNKKQDIIVILEEYKALRQEALTRMNNRISLLTSSIASSGILLGIALGSNVPQLLLLVPVITCLFGLLSIYHTIQISDLLDYIKHCIEVRINESYPMALGWHSSHPAPMQRFAYLFGTWHLPMVLTTLVPSFCALILFLIKPVWDIVMLALFIIDILIIFYFLFQYFIKSGKRKSQRKKATDKWIKKLRKKNLLK